MPSRHVAFGRRAFDHLRNAHARSVLEHTPSEHSVGCRTSYTVSGDAHLGFRHLHDSDWLATRALCLELCPCMVRGQRSDQTHRLSYFSPWCVPLFSPVRSHRQSRVVSEDSPPATPFRRSCLITDSRDSAMGSSASPTIDINARPWSQGCRLGRFGKNPLDGIA